MQGKWEMSCWQSGHNSLHEAPPDEEWVENESDQQKTFIKYWKKINGDPQKKNINYVDWIELIKFRETRNYVQRVLENVNVYKYMLAKKPIKIQNYFIDKPHY